MIRINEKNQMEVYNVVPVYRGSRIIKFLTSVSMADINSVYDRIVYDIDTQRGERVKKLKKQIIREKIMSKANIEEMKEKIKNEFFDGSTLMWNVRLDKTEELDKFVDFIPEESKIVIKAPYVTLPDSAQRHQVIRDLRLFTLAVDQSTYFFPLTICCYTLAEEQDLFCELNATGLKACKTRALYLSNASKNLLVKEIIKDSNLKNNVEFVSDVVYRKNKVVSFATLYNSLFGRGVGAYKNLDEDSTKEFKNWIIRFYNRLIEVRPELAVLEEGERDKLNQVSIVGSQSMWFVYANIAKALEGDPNWTKKIQRLNSPYRAGQWSGDIMSLENPVWHGTVSLQSKAGTWRLTNTKTTQKFINDIMMKHLNLF